MKGISTMMQYMMTLCNRLIKSLTLHCACITSSRVGHRCRFVISSSPLVMTWGYTPRSHTAPIPSPSLVPCIELRPHAKCVDICSLNAHSAHSRNRVMYPDRLTHFLHISFPLRTDLSSMMAQPISSHRFASSIIRPVSSSE